MMHGYWLVLQRTFRLMLISHMYCTEEDRSIIHIRMHKKTKKKKYYNIFGDRCLRDFAQHPQNMLSDVHATLGRILWYHLVTDVAKGFLAITSSLDRFRCQNEPICI